MLQCETIKRKDIMAAKVTLLIFWYFLLLTNVLHATSDETKSNTMTATATVTATVTVTATTQTTPAQSTTATPAAIDNTTPIATMQPDNTITSLITSAASQSTKQQAQTTQTTSSLSTASGTISPPAGNTTANTTASTASGTISPPAGNTTANTTAGNSKPTSGTPLNKKELKDTKNPDTLQASSIDKRYFWLFLLLGAVVGLLIYMKLKCFKVQHPVETMDHGTENASFQRTESNKDGVMLLGVKSGGEENAK